MIEVSAKEGAMGAGKYLRFDLLIQNALAFPSVRTSMSVLYGFFSLGVVVQDLFYAEIYVSFRRLRHY